MCDRFRVSARIYPAVVVDVVDGDTLRVFLDRGGDDWWHASLRLLGGNTWERGHPGYDEARAYLAAMCYPITPGSFAEMFARNSPRGVVTSEGWDKYGGRIDGTLTLPSGVDVTQRMITAGYMAAWDGRGARPVPPWPIPGR